MPAKPEPVPAPSDKKKAEDQTRAKLSVELPAGAKLFVQGREMQTNGASPYEFVTPVLERGAGYSYAIKVVGTVDGEVAEQTRQVALQAGQSINVRFDNLTVQAPSSNRARVVVRLPKEAKLRVDDVEIDGSSDVRTFRTPKLEPGQQYYYTMRAELTVDGQTLVDSKRVAVEAGKRAEVRFDKLSRGLSVSAR